jgi:5-methylcytosine-specific restriction endonuclease McrA
MDNQQVYEDLRRRRSARNIDYKLVHCWKRQPIEQWNVTRRRIYERDGGICKSPPTAAPKVFGFCLVDVDFKECHIDHIRPLSSGGSNHASNLRVLCPVCHALREDEKHRSLTSSLVRSGLIPVRWQQYTWV